MTITKKSMRKTSPNKHIVPGTTTALLSSPSKMPGYSFGLPAHRACPRANGTICDGCYASRGAYSWSNVARAYEARFTWVRECMKTSEGRAEFMRVMVREIAWATRQQPYFRIHDSGDFFSPTYVACWLEIARALPDVRFWAPTRAYQQPTRAGFVILGQDDAILGTLRAMAALPNVTIRPSALNFGDDAPVVDGLAAGSTADGAGFQCPAPSQENQCGDCRACWNNKAESVSYRKH